MSIYNEDLIEQREHQLSAGPPMSTGQQAAAARAQFDQTPLGPVPLAYDVRAIYDSRPVNGSDFNITQSASGELTNPIDVSFTVPNGYVAVLKRVITFLEDPIPDSVLRSDVLLTLLLNQGVVPFNERIPVGVEQDSLVNCFVIADQGSVLSARFIVSAEILALQPTYTVQFYGNFLQKTNIPASFEIANPTNKSVGQPNLLPMIAPAQALSPAPMLTPTPIASGPAIPPFPVEWSYSLNQKPRVYVPVTSSGGKKRVLTTDEQFIYREYLDATRPRG